MGANAKEKALIKEQYNAMSASGKIEYIVQNYRLELILISVAIVILVTTAFRWITHKDPYLYVGFANVTMGEDFESRLTTEALETITENPKKKEILVYKNLYLSKDPAQEDHEYAYASQMKVMASATAGQFDVVIMNKGAYDVLSEGNYLLDLKSSLPEYDEELCKELSPYMCENDIVISSNAIDVQMNTQEELEIVTETKCNAIQADTFSLFKSAGFDNNVYIGILNGSKRMDNVISYIRYLTH